MELNNPRTLIHHKQKEPNQIKPFKRNSREWIMRVQREFGRWAFTHFFNETHHLTVVFLISSNYTRSPHHNSSKNTSQLILMVKLHVLHLLIVCIIFLLFPFWFLLFWLFFADVVFFFWLKSRLNINILNWSGSLFILLANWRLKRKRYHCLFHGITGLISWSL